jgi:PAS domain S-box-containing protein
MDVVFSTLLDMSTSRDWLVTANFILSVLLCLWMLRYRKLYFETRDEQKNNKDLIENLSEGIYRSTPDGRQLRANRALVKLNGYSSEEELLAGVKDIGKEWYVEPTRRDEFRAILRRDGRVEDFVSEIFRHKSRERIWITESARVVRHGKTGKALYYEGSVREITETVKPEDRGAVPEADQPASRRAVPVRPPCGRSSFGAISQPRLLAHPRPARHDDDGDAEAVRGLHSSA